MAVEPATVIITPLACHKFNKSGEIKDKRAIPLFNNVDDLIYKFLRLVVVRKWVGVTHGYLPFRNYFLRLFGQIWSIGSKVSGSYGVTFFSFSKVGLLGKV